MYCTYFSLHPRLQSPSKVNGHILMWFSFTLLLWIYTLGPRHWKSFWMQIGYRTRDIQRASEPSKFVLDCPDPNILSPSFSLSNPYSPKHLRTDRIHITCLIPYLHPKKLLQTLTSRPMFLLRSPFHYIVSLFFFGISQKCCACFKTFQFWMTILLLIPLS